MSFSGIKAHDMQVACLGSRAGWSKIHEARARDFLGELLDLEALCKREIHVMRPLPLAPGSWG